MSFRTLRITLVLFFLLSLPMMPRTAEAQEDNRGFIYGHIVTNSGSEYEGFLRWGTQEAFWDDLFHSVKEHLPYYDYLDGDQSDQLRGRGSRMTVFDWDVTIEGEFPSPRQFISRFGDIASIEQYREGRIDLVMKNGTEIEVAGGSDDLSDDVHVSDPSLGEIDLRWNRIERIEFLPVPRDADPGVTRLFGTVETREGEYQGFIQWDKDECLSTDVLDGDTEDGGVSIRMGSIRSIERLSRRGSLVTLNDGRELRLGGSNDVNEENRGIMVEDERFGRVTVDWSSFDQVTFSEARNTGQGYRDYEPLGALTGTVIDVDGQRYTGRLVFDLDESEGWEMLNGSLDRITFDIPFAQVASVEPMRGGYSRIVLKNGEELTLEESHDVGDDNSGLLVFGDRDDPTYIAWKYVELIEFEH